ncbi:MAG: hypothetical protein A3G11_01525 [Candidatus Lloydbacteria bacterium RIFCSPLOWO2_12_FULL_51_9]|uniref:Uncharacterized protein n=1 Tax=Candidatus Lloydbacteria bacterium RIFCSPLOWO2_12_FULL_51_9 TaxID=1798669 RepID=A0A1G2DRZ7_9BACT|nr:MAG: hypothetical protein A3G11_01525 [Candidatus Lloydbacteria bacterium RIFCSPLOWO2_12_FULL_51_9]
MTPERWETIKESVKKQFTVIEQGNEDLIVETADGQIKQGTAEFVVFESPLGRTKLQFQKKPKMEEKKYFYSKREGDAARVEYKFSEKETVFTFKAYKWDDIEDEWREIDPKTFE